MKIKIGLIFSSLFLFFLAAEILLALFHLPKENPYLRKDLSWQQQYVVLNSAGYRDREFSKDKSPDTFRIYSVGDSYTFGWLIDDPNKSYPKIIEKKLNQKNLSKKIEVINAGTPGFSIFEDANRLISEGLSYHPDLVLFAMTDDRVITTEQIYPSPPDAFVPNFIKNLRIYKLLIVPLTRSLSEREYQNNLYQAYSNKNSKDWKIFSAQLLAMKNAAEKNNSSLGIILYPHVKPMKPNDPYDLLVYNKRFADFSKQNNILLIDPLKDFLNYKDKERLVVNPIDAHPTAEMNEIVGNAFIKQFNISSYMETHTYNKPKIGEVIVTKDTKTIGDFTFIRNLTSNIPDDPWIYFETKNGNNLQEFPLSNSTTRETKFYIDRLQVSKAHSGIIGAEITHYIYPKSNNELLLPETIYGYPIIGFNNIYGIYVDSGNNHSDYIDVVNVRKKDGIFIIKYKKLNPYILIRFNLKVGLKQIDFNEDGLIENITKTIELEKISEKDSTSITISTPQTLLGFPLLFEPTKTFYYAFVDQALTKVENIEQTKDTIILKFDHIIKKGQKVIISSAVDYTLSEEESLRVEVEN